MKAKTIIALIVAVALILSGSVLIFWGLKSVDFDFSKEAATKTYVVSDTFQSIEIDSDTCDVVLVKTDGEFRAVCPDSEKLSCAVIVEDNVLKISAVDIHHWTDFIGVFHQEMRITVYLPESQYEHLQIETSTGDITVPADFSFDTAQVCASTGEIDFSAAVAAHLTVAATTGDIHVQDISTDRIEIAATTGDVQVQNADCDVIVCGTSTGSITFRQVIAQTYLGVCSSTGDILLEDCDSADVNIETTTGDVTGHFLTPKWFITSTSTGDVDVPLSREGGECRITTTTGDITFH